MRNNTENVEVDQGKIRNAWRSYYEYLLNEKYPWNRRHPRGSRACAKTTLKYSDWMMAANGKVKKDETVGNTGIVTEIQ